MNINIYIYIIHYHTIIYYYTLLIIISHHMSSYLITAWSISKDHVYGDLGSNMDLCGGDPFWAEKTSFLNWSVLLKMACFEQHSKSVFSMVFERFGFNASRNLKSLQKGIARLSKDSLASKAICICHFTFSSRFGRQN